MVQAHSLAASIRRSLEKKYKDREWEYGDVPLFLLE